MSRRTFRRTIVLALVLSAGLVSTSNAYARVRADREPAIRQEASFRTVIGNAWNLVQGLFGKNHIAPGPNPPQPEGPALCPLGKPARSSAQGQPGNPGGGN